MSGPRTAHGSRHVADHSPLGPRGGRRLRARLVLIVVGVVTSAAVLLSLLAFGLVSRSLRSEVLARAVEEARFNTEVLVEERLDTDVTAGEISESGLADDFARRDVDVYVDLGDGGDFASGLNVVNATDVVSPRTSELLDQGRIAAEWVDIEDVPHLIVAVRRPPQGPDFYFFNDVGGTADALDQLRVVLLGATALLIVLGAVAGLRVARLAGSLADTVDELSAARDRERRFVSDVSHELRTPVTALVHEAAELRAGIEGVPHGVRRVVELLDGDVRRLRDLVEELLELSRLDATDPDPADPDLGDPDPGHPGATAGDPTGQLAAVDVSAFLHALVARRLPSADVSVPDGLLVHTDRRRLERIVANLLDNAVEHAGGKSVTLRAEVSDTELILEVGDRGPGVKADDVERIFDRFTKADTSRASGGSGLGLAITREHARLMGAVVRARNRDGGGLLVEVRVPVQVVAEL